MMIMIKKTMSFKVTYNKLFKKSITKYGESQNFIEYKI